MTTARTMSRLAWTVVICNLPVAATSQELPGWSIAQICAKEPAQCREFEARARQAVSGGWGVLPEGYRKACLAEVTSPLDHSWRLLSQCIELQVLRGMDKEAIATALTPAEPVPPPRPAVPGANEASAPPPPFGLPAELPKAD